MKLGNTFKVMIGVAAGYGVWEMYKKINPNIENDIKKKVSEMSKTATESIENMM